MYMVTTSFMKILKFWTLNFFIFFILERILNFLKIWNFTKFFENWNFLNFLENFEILGNFLNLLKIWNFFKIFGIFWNFRNLEIFLKISESSLIDVEIQVFRINIKLLSNPVAELKILENDSHCRSIVLKAMDRSIVKNWKRRKIAILM